MVEQHLGGLLDIAIIIEFVKPDYQVQYPLEIYAENFAIPIAVCVPLYLLVHKLH